MKDEELKSTALVIPQLIVGLGNPEPKYDQTRHNIGFAAIDTLARAWQISLAENLSGSTPTRRCLARTSPCRERSL